MAICAPRVVFRLVGDTAASAPQPLAGLEDVEAYLEQHRVPSSGHPSSRHPVERPHPEEWRQALPTLGAAGTGEARSLHLAEQRRLEEWRQALPTLCAIRPTVTSEADLVGRAGSAG